MASGSSANGAALVAILRGVVPERVVGIGDVLYAAGFRMIEVPLNSPDPFASIAALAACNRPDWIVGAGTVLTVADVQRTQAAGGRLVVAPNCDPEVIRSAVQLGMRVMPGFATATEAFQAIQAGAQDLKLFPACTYGPRHLQALRAVLPTSVRVFPVGGVGVADIAAWLTAGASGFGLGSELFRPEYELEEIAQRAADLVRAVSEARP
ncbi:MAG: 2-dehydro-3-deoxy-6-phosphogalactonate aldolase [Gammaproteobacteria bacterium]|nr:2-dehydro-3-deoxy-6-phosphogalactonate aldolase [Gammaproteobacteria bacterium]